MVFANSSGIGNLMPNISPFAGYKNSCNIMGTIPINNFVHDSERSIQLFSDATLDFALAKAAARRKCDARGLCR